MNPGTILSVVLVIGTLLGIHPGCARAQLFPNAKMTEEFRGVLDQLASKNGGAFVSACRGPGKTDMAILLIGVGSNLANLPLWTSGKVYNGAGFEIKGGRINFVEGGGGEWSMRKLQFYAQELAGSEFHLDFPVQLRSLLKTRPRRVCREFRDKPASPVS